jgi:murein DD-endopeptidase MepM/ murein hydrolase activator NlpD
MPLLVDTTLPVLRAARSVAAKLGSGDIRIRIPVTISEESTVRVSRGSKLWSAHFDRGSRKVIVAGSDLGIAARTSRQRIAVTVTAIDAAGNKVSKRVHVNVPARANPNPPATPTTPATPTGGFVWPLSGVLTSPFGPRDGRLHAGLDIAAPTGTPAGAAAGGIVSFAATQSGYGNIVIVEHPGGTSTAYAHLSKISVVVGQIVSAGQQVGLVGTTGHSSGPHLHFEIRENGHAVDPLPKLPAR